MVLKHLWIEFLIWNDPGPPNGLYLPSFLGVL